ncbi:pimeloyl-ACP methyl ester carboxylesterase [Saccharothrix tamanrassetensis]|uniref:Pimeloyl-ACP methyl ester carboxylesterase n=1 Tax=Saccharothrix tamanrassetensis TaxID=1051531 RepID=A0A841CVG8_9PSEU|nr:alpha/beta fold hydrolase [Saccharothrix tamanrassetensis]MBB5960304.1 pimeloyl-ACP methyl ester carboxylesterase [Saccharothrix tamanrassetensis]
MESEGVRLSVYERGDRSAPTVVLVHGYPDTHRVWDGIAEILAEEFHVVTYDVRGAGASDRPRGLAAYRLPVLARDLFAVADAVSPGEPVHVVAHDWGSIQSWEAVTTPGARIASYTSISGPCLDHVGYLMRRRPTIGQVKQLLHSWYIVAFHLPFVAPFVWRRFIGPRWEQLMRGVGGAKAHVGPTIVDDGVHGMSLYRANFIPRIRSPRERRTDVPVQLVQLLKDKFVTAAVLEDLEHWAPNLRRRVLDASHWAPITHARPLARLVADHVTAHTAPGPRTGELPAPDPAPGSTSANRRP